MAQIGTSKIGTRQIAANRADATTAPMSATGKVGGIGGPNVTILNPRNLQTTYDESRSAFVSEWFEETAVVPEDAIETVVVTADLRSDNPITVYAERDDTGDGIVDDRSKTYETGHGYVEPLQDIEAVEGSRYRIVFPNYSRDDDVTAVRLALTWDNEEEIRDEWPLQGIDTNSGFVGDVLSTYASALHSFDTRIDEEYDNRFLNTASGPVLDTHGAPVGINRRSAEQDDDLRYRIGVEYAIYLSDGTLSSTEAVLERLFDTPSDVTWDLVDNQPTVTIPEALVDSTTFAQSTIESKLEQAMPSSYGLFVVMLLVAAGETVTKTSPYVFTDSSAIRGTLEIQA